jgi:hypothetical protein
MKVGALRMSGIGSPQYIMLWLSAKVSWYASPKLPFASRSITRLIPTLEYQGPHITTRTFTDSVSCTFPKLVGNHASAVSTVIWLEQILYPLCVQVFAMVQIQASQTLEVALCRCLVHLLQDSRFSINARTSSRCCSPWLPFLQ